MISWALIAMAASTTTPAKAEPTIAPSKWILHSDIPQSEWKRAATTTFDLTISEAGEPIKCDIFVASGSDILDRTVCTSAMKRARFKPAHDAAGLPVVSVWRDRVIWQPVGDGTNRWFDGPDVIAGTDELIGKKTKMTTVIVAIKDNGEIDQCFVAKSSRLQSLDARACEIARSAEISTPITNDKGVMVNGIRSFFVGFRSGPVSSIVLK